MIDSDGLWQSHALALLTALANGGQPEIVRDRAARGRLEKAKIDGLERLAGGPPSLLQRIYESAWLAQRKATQEMIAELNRRGIEPVMFKGMELATRYLVGCLPSLMADVDFVVRRTDLGLARAALLGLGYRQAAYSEERQSLDDADIVEIARMEGSHYQLFPFRRIQPLDLSGDEIQAIREGLVGMPILIDSEDQASIVLEFDVHHAVALDIDTLPLLERAQSSVFPGALSFCDADQLWIATARYYNEVAIHNKRTLRDFAYIVALVKSGCVHWDVVLDAANRQELHPALYYYFRFVESLFRAPTIPSEIMASLDPRLGSRRRDWGWQLGPLFETIDPMPSLVGT